MAKITTTRGEFKELLKETINTMAQQGSPELKAMIKVCIQEVLAESNMGGGMAVAQYPQAAPYVPPMGGYQQPGMGYGIQQPQPYGMGGGFGPMGPQQMMPNPNLQHTVSTMAQRMAGGDPKQAKIFENLLSDTANNTLQQTLAFEQHGATPQQLAADQMSMQRISGPDNRNARGRWAELAFNTQPTMGGMLKG